LLKQGGFQLLPKSRQQIGQCDIVRQPVPELCYCNRKRSTADGDSLNRGISRRFNPAEQSAHGSGNKHIIIITIITLLPSSSLILITKYSL